MGDKTLPGAPNQVAGRIPRCPGFRYGPKIHSQAYNGTTVYHVEQKGFWMDASIVGPTKPTTREALAAWKRLLKTKATKGKK